MEMGCLKVSCLCARVLGVVHLIEAIEHREYPPVLDELSGDPAVQLVVDRESVAQPRGQIGAVPPGHIDPNRHRSCRPDCVRQSRPLPQEVEYQIDGCHGFPGAGFAQDHHSRGRLEGVEPFTEIHQVHDPGVGAGQSLARSDIQPDVDAGARTRRQLIQQPSFTALHRISQGVTGDFDRQARCVRPQLPKSPQGALRRYRCAALDHGNIGAGTTHGMRAFLIQPKKHRSVMSESLRRQCRSKAAAMDANELDGWIATQS